MPAIFADIKYIKIFKKVLAEMASGNIDGCTANKEDNTKYNCNTGDNLIGKPAIDKYWKVRRMNVIETISVINNIWFPIIVNKPEQLERNGFWLLG